MQREPNTALLDPCNIKSMGCNNPLGSSIARYSVKLQKFTGYRVIELLGISP